MRFGKEKGFSITAALHLCRNSPEQVRQRRRGQALCTHPHNTHLPRLPVTFPGTHKKQSGAQTVSVVFPCGTGAGTPGLRTLGEGTWRCPPCALPCLLFSVFCFQTCGPPCRRRKPFPQSSSVRIWVLPTNHTSGEKQSSCCSLQEVVSSAQLDSIQCKGLMLAS